MAAIQSIENNSKTEPVTSPADVSPAEKKAGVREPKSLTEIATFGSLSIAILAAFILLPSSLNWVEQQREESEPFLYNMLFWYPVVIGIIGLTTSAYKRLTPKISALESLPSQPQSTFSAPPHPHLSTQIAAQRFFR